MTKKCLVCQGTGLTQRSNGGLSGCLSCEGKGDSTPAPKAIEALPEVTRKLVFKHFTGSELEAVTRTVWKDGIDISEPSRSLIAFAQDYARSAVSAALAAAQAEQASTATHQQALQVAPPSPPSDRGPAGTPPPVEQEVYGYLTPASFGRRFFYPPQDCTESMKRTYTPVFSAPPQADRADAELWLVREDDADRWDYTRTKPNHLMAAGWQVRAFKEVVAARATQEPLK